jgi:hypothetical protein
MYIAFFFWFTGLFSNRVAVKNFNFLMYLDTIIFMHVAKSKPTKI